MGGREVTLNLDNVCKYTGFFLEIAPKLIRILSLLLNLFDILLEHTCLPIVNTYIKSNKLIQMLPSSVQVKFSASQIGDKYIASTQEAEIWYAS